MGVAEETFEGRFVEILPPSEVAGEGEGEGDTLWDSAAVPGQQGRAWLGGKPDEYVVDLFSGSSVTLPASRLRAFEPRAGEDGGFDLTWPTAEEFLEPFGWDVADKLVTKGFCVVQCYLGEAAHKGASEAVKGVNGWKRFVEEFEPAYLGRGAQGKAAWLESDLPDSEAGSGLELCDRLLTETSLALEPVSQAMFGFGTIGRTDGLVRAPFDGMADEEQVMQERVALDDVEVQVKGRVEEHLKFVQQRRIGMVYFVRGSGGSFTLHPKDGLDIGLPCKEGKLIIFRHDRLGFTYSPSGKDDLALQAWVLAEGQGTMLQQFDGPIDQYDQALGLCSGPTAPLYGVTGKAVGLMSMDCMLAMNGLGPEFFWSGLVAGTDGGRHLSPLRWDPDAYYIGDKDLAFGKYYSNHGGFVLEETCLAFDHKFFGFNEEDVYVLDPCQRNSMEVGYNTLYKAGWNRKTLNNAHIGTYFGNCGTDWQGVRLNPMFNPCTPQTYLGSNAHITAVRLNYIFGMRGPNSTSDTACSSSLVAIGSAMNALRRLEPDQLRISNNSFIEWALCVGTNGLWGPFSWIGLCGPRMLSSKGRCFTFDHSADGFGRGEGTSAVSMSITEKEPSGRLAMFCGTCINQDGRSASMTAPHGPSQQECLRASMREANIVPGDVRVAELHGTGTALGDPIEVGALRGVMKVRSLPICKTSAKSNLEHGEANAGMAGLIKCFTVLQHGTCPCNIHLKDLNPHCDVNAYPVLFADDSTDLGTGSGYAGVSSFGFGGTNARADLWAKATQGPRKTGKLDDNKLDYITVRCTKCMGWMDHVGAIAIQTAPPKPQGGRFKACCIREEGSNYDFCSKCYTGGYTFGTPPTESPMPKGKIYITGTWDGWSSQELIEQAPDGAYHYFTRLGETRMESFYFTVEQNEGFAIFPAAKHAGLEIRTVGPLKREEGHAWLIDGRDEEWPEGTLMHVTLAANRDTGFREVSWERVPEEGGPSELQKFQHGYCVRGSWTAGQMVPMTKVHGKRNTFEYKTRIGISGQESFQISRDGDTDQLIYPATPSTSRLGVPVRGPDHLGTGSHWVVHGQQSGTLTIRLEVIDAHVTVTAISSSGTRRWDSMDGRARKKFFVSGSWSEDCIPMHEDPENPDLYRLRVEMQSQLEEFQIFVDEDPRRAFHPQVGGFPCGAVFVCGPDDDGRNDHFTLQGEAGVSYEILLDLKSQDKRWTVAWKPVMPDGMPSLPWSPEAKYGIRDAPDR